MKKVIVICPINDLKANQTKLKKCQTIGFRAKNGDRKDVFCKQDFEIYPPDKGSIEFSSVKDEIIFRLKVLPGEIVAIGDDEGTVKKVLLPSKEK